MTKRLLLLFFGLTFALQSLAATRLERAIPDAGERRAVAHALELIAHGGPFPYRQHGVVFQNREGRVTAHARGSHPQEPRPPPGASHHGARRVSNGSPGDEDETRTHYRAFVGVHSTGR